MKKRLILSTFAIAMATSLTGCLATNALNKIRPICLSDVCSKPSNTKTIQHTLLKDSYVAIAKPKTPIAGYPNALLLIGKNSTLILTPQNADDVKFFQNLSQFDMRYLFLYLDYYSGDGNKIEVKTPNYTINQVETLVRVKFSRHVDLPATTKEKQLLAELGFELTSNNNAVYSRDDVRFEYGKDVELNITAIPALPNANLTHTFRQPIELEFYRSEEKYSPTKATIAAVSPLLFLTALAIDVVTFPIQAVGVGAYEVIKEKGEK